MPHACHIPRQFRILDALVVIAVAAFFVAAIVGHLGEIAQGFTVAALFGAIAAALPTALAVAIAKGRPSKGEPHWIFRSIGAASISIFLTACIWTWALLNARVDVADWIWLVVWPCEVVAKVYLCIAAVVSAGIVQQQVYSSKTRCLVAIAVWSLASLISISVLLLSRRILVELDDGGVSHWIPVEELPDDGSFLSHYASRLRPRYLNLEIPIVELMLAFILVLLISLVGYYFGRNRRLAQGVSSPFAISLVIAVCMTFQLFEIDWDNFHYGIWSNAVSAEMVFFPFTSFVTLPVATFVFCTMIVSSVVASAICRRIGP